MIVREMHRDADIIRKTLQSGNYSTEEEKKMLTAQFKALNALLQYVVSGDWACESTKKKLLLYIKSKFDVKYVCKACNTSPECFYVFLNRQDRKLRRIMGEAYDLIYSGRIADGMKAFNIAACSDSVADEIYYDTRELLPKAECKDGITVSDCKTELDILSVLTKNSQKNFLADFDTEKLSHLLFLLTTKEKAYQGQRKQVIAAIMGYET